MARNSKRPIKHYFDVIDHAIDWLQKSGKSKKILVKQIRNLGDTLHLTPVIHHYRLKHPNAAIAFITGDTYANAHRRNPHIDKLFLVDAKADPQSRLQLWDRIKKAKGVDIAIIASIFPFGEKHPQNKWCHENIADQYLHNSGIKNLKPLGGRKLIVELSDEDEKWAEKFIKDNNLDRNKTIAYEYHSYSAPPVWKKAQFEQLSKNLDKHGFKCISIAGPKEGLVNGTVDGRGMTWRQTVALMDRIYGMVGVGSGITMLAAAAKNPPKIFELAIPRSISMSGCKYADSTSIMKPNPKKVCNKIISST